MDFNSIDWSKLAEGAAIWWFVSAAIDTMPEPQEGERWYSWAYRFLHAVAANISKARGVKPQ
jgi:hypothetical protein